MFKRAKVVMLPTNEKAQIHMTPEGHMYKSVEEFIQASQAYKSYHLYITSDDEIKEGDWCLNLKNNHIFQASYTDANNINSTDTAYDKYNSCKKIIATTNIHLGWTNIGQDERGNTLGNYITKGNGALLNSYDLPQPSQAFIEKYVEEYNKDNIITDVLVEYEGIETCPNNTWKNAGTMELALISVNDLEYPYRNKLKVNPKDNTITIKKVKDSWSRKEVENKLWEIRTFYQETKDLPYKQVRPLFKNWINKNL